MKKNQKSFGLPIGCPSLIMVLVIMCLTTFSVISYVLAEREYKFSKKTVESIAEYQEADNRANTIISDIHSSIVNGKSYEIVAKEKYGPADVSVFNTGNNYTAELSIPVKDEIILYVKADFNSDGYQKAVVWKVIDRRIQDSEPVYLDLPTFF